MNALQITLAYSLHEVIRRFGRKPLDEFWVCSAYLRLDGVRAITPFLKARSIRVVLGAGEQTEPAAVEDLTARKAAVRLRRHTAMSEFHPKCYLALEPGGRAWSAVGSANLTGRGVIGNVELLTVVEGDAADAYFRSLLEWLREQHRLGHRPSAEIMQGIMAMFAAGATATKAQRDAQRKLDEAFGRAEAVRQRRSILTYIRKTRLLTSYKLVILGVLLQASNGRLGVEECARRFQAFYGVMEKSGLPAERSLRGFKQPAMRVPLEHDLKRVIRLLEGRKGLTIKKRGFVSYRDGAGGTDLVAGATLTAEERQEALSAVVDRLGQYYRERVGAERGNQAIRRALGTWAE